MDSENAIIQQSDRHPDGWGVAYYNMGSPHLVRNDNQAKECKIFEKVSGVVASNTVVTHIRKSTVGSVGPLNTHPFQFGPWVFAHNGNVENFSEIKEALKARIDPDLRKFILGETDSEHIFYLLLSIFKRQKVLKSEDGVSLDFAPILEELVTTFVAVAGPLRHSQGDYDKNYLTFIITDGRSMFAFNGGQDLLYSTHKNLCSERATCPHFHPVCEKRADIGQKVHHLLISSEVIKNENLWSPLNFGEFIGVDQNFELQMGQLQMSGA